MAFIFRSSHTKIKPSFLPHNLDRNKTGSRRFKPNSCIILINEQLNHLHILQCMDIISRHRGDKHKRRYGRLIYIILLSLKYLLFDDQIINHCNYLVQ